MATYSHSKLQTFEQCLLKYKFRYIDKILVLRKSIEAFLGSIVHETLEWLYNQVKKRNLPSIDDTIMRYIRQWELKYKPEVYIVNEGLTTKDYFNKGIKFILGYYTQHHPFDDNTLETEKKVYIDLDPSGEKKLMGVIDRLAHNPKTDEIEIHDYKTSNSLPTQEKIEQDKQLAMYSIAIKEEFQNKNVKLIWHYLAFNKKVHSTRTNEQLEQLKKETIELIKKIESTVEFPPNKSVLCSWCEYREMCPAWIQFPEEKVKDIISIRGKGESKEEND